MSSLIVGAVVGAVIGAGSSIRGIGKGNRNQIKAFKEQMEAVMKNYNYNQNYADKQSVALYDSATAELFNLSLNAIQNNATVENALAEAGYEGRTKGQTIRTLNGQVLRQKTAQKEAHALEETNIRTQKENLYIQTKSNVANATKQLDTNLTKGMQSFMKILDSTAKGAAMGAATAGAGSAFSGAASAAGSGAASAAGSGAASASTAVSMATKFKAGMSGFNQWYTQYGSMYSNMFQVLDGMSSQLGNKRGQGGYYY